MFRFFERLLEPTEAARSAAAGTRQPACAVALLLALCAPGAGLLVALFVAGFMVALLDTAIPVFIGRIVTPGLDAAAGDAAAARPAGSSPAWRWCCWSLRPSALLLQALVTNQAIAPASPTWSAGRAIGMSCARAGRSSRTISPAASPTASCRPDRRCARASSPAPTRSGTSWSMAAARSCCWRGRLAARACRCSVVRGYAVVAARISCRACATARARCRRCARR